MNAAAIESIWKAIQESERSDEFPFIDDEKSITAAAHMAPQPQPDQSSAVSRDPITAIAINPKPAAGDSLHPLRGCETTQLGAVAARSAT